MNKKSRIKTGKEHLRLKRVAPPKEEFVVYDPLFYLCALIRAARLERLERAKVRQRKIHERMDSKRYC